MRESLTGVLYSLRQRRALRRWERIAEMAQDTSLQNLKQIRTMARQIEQRVGAVGRIAESRLIRPPVGGAPISLPPATDWSFRPDAWVHPLVPKAHVPAGRQTRLGEQVALYHDSRTPAVAIHQKRDRGTDDLTPFSVAVEIYDFDGSFLSLVLQAEGGAVRNLGKTHILRVDFDIESERPIEGYCRLNLRNGPNTEQITQAVDYAARRGKVEFDLAYSKFNERRSEEIWFDLFFENPSMNRIEIRDVTLSRRLRSEI
jgi:hypothetical protein